jgi:hypothetical protein
MKRLTGGQGATGPAGTVSAAGSGTAAAPGIAFASDPNTGIYNPGADQVAISTGGAGRLFVDASGNVGMGTSSFTTYGGAQQVLALDGSAVSRVDFYNGGTKIGDITSATFAGFGLNISTVSTQPLLLGTNSATRLAITSAGNVGIGVSSPVSLFQIRVATNKNIAFGLLSGEARITCYNDAVSATSSLGLNGSDLRFQVNDSEKARLDSSGKFLIGTSTAVTGSSALLQCSTTVNLGSVATYADNTTAAAGGLAVGDVYKTALGVLMIRY